MKKPCKSCSCRPCCCKEFSLRLHVCLYQRECWCGSRARECARSNTPSCWPMKMDALACHPKQIEEIMARNKKHGITGVSYEADGTCVLTDRKARQELMALEGVHDNHGGYSDDHAGQSPLYREDSVPLTDLPLEMRYEGQPVFER